MIKQATVVRIDPLSPCASGESVVKARVAISADRAPALRWLQDQANYVTQAEAQSPLDAPGCSPVKSSVGLLASEKSRGLVAKLSFSRAAQRQGTDGTSTAGSAALQRARANKPSGVELSDGDAEVLATKVRADAEARTRARAESRRAHPSNDDGPDTEQLGI